MKNSFQMIPASSKATELLTPTEVQNNGLNEMSNRVESVIGYGYNVLNCSYINPMDVMTRYPILKVDDENFKKLIKTISAKEMDQVFESGRTVVELLEKISANVSAGVKTSLFSAQVKTEFAFSEKSESEYFYFKYMNVCIRSRQSLGGGDEFKKYFHPQFLQDLEGAQAISVEQLFNRYGTHLITDICLGGRMDVNFSYNKDYTETEKNIKAEVEAAYMCFSAKAGASYDEKTKKVIERSKIVTKAVGGKTSTMTSIEDFKVKCDEWTNSLDEEKNWEICHLPKHGREQNQSLVPIWELCKDAKRRATIEKFFNDRVNEIKNEFDALQGYVVDFTFVADKNPVAAKNKRPNGYILIDKDLNKGAGGDFIYLCYKRDNTGTPYTDMFNEISGSSKRAETRNAIHHNHTASYTRNGVNLNNDTRVKGDYIYTNGTKDKRYAPIKRLQVIYENELKADNWEFVCWQGTNDPADCNKTVRGNFIYIIMEK